MDHGSGLLRAFLHQLWTILKGVGRIARAVVSGSRTLADGLAEALGRILSLRQKTFAGLLDSRRSDMFEL